MELNPIGSSSYVAQCDPHTGLPLPDEKEKMLKFARASAELLPGYVLEAVNMIPQFDSPENEKAFIQGFRGSLEWLGRSVTTLACCFSLKNDNNLMWSHYAKDHTGFCVGFKTSSPIFRNRLGRSNLSKIIYSDTPPQGSYDTIHRRRYLVKSEEWSYEEEIRSLSISDHCRKIDINGSIIYIRDFSMSDVDSVIFGHRISSDIKERLQTSSGSQVTKYSVSKKTSSYNLEVIKL